MIDCYYPNIRVFAAFVPLIRSRARSTLMTSRRLNPPKPTWQRVCLADCSPDRRNAILALLSHQTLLPSFSYNVDCKGDSCIDGSRDFVTFLHVYSSACSPSKQQHPTGHLFVICAVKIARALAPKLENPALALQVFLRLMHTGHLS
jgi:hypothetical protein